MNKINITLSVVVVILSIVLLPQFIIFLGYFKTHNIYALSVFLSEIDFLGNVLMLREKEFFKNWLYLQPGVVLLIVLLFWTEGSKKKRISDFGTPEVTGSGEFGTSRWRTTREVSKSTTVWLLDKTNTPMTSANPFAKKRSDKKVLKEIGGNILGFEVKKNKAYLDTEDTNTLIIGTSRSGKTRTWLFPTIWGLGRAKESMVITDPKGEIFELTSIYLEKQGYEVIKLDFRDAKFSRRWNVMEPVNQAILENNYAKASEAANDIAHAIVFQGERKGDPLWANGEASVIAAVILAVATSDIPVGEKNMYNVYLNIIELGKPVIKETPYGPMEIVPLNEFFSSLPPGHIAKSAFGTAELSPEKMRGSFFSSAAASLRLFADPGLAYTTAIQDHDMGSIGQKPTAVFLCIPDEKTTNHVLASMYVNQIYMKLVEVANANGGRLPIRVNMLLDEFGNMPAVPDFDTKVTVSLGRGIRWSLIVQDLQQLNKRYGQNAATITGNCHTWIYLLTTDEKTAEAISKRTGKYTIETESRSSSIQDRGSSRTTSAGMTGRPLLTADEILRWPKENALVFQARLHPAHLELPDFTKWDYLMEEFIKLKDETVLGEVSLPNMYLLGRGVKVVSEKIGLEEKFSNLKREKENYEDIEYEL